MFAMAPDDETPHASEARIAAASDETARVQFALNQAESHLARMAPSPTKRRLAGSLEVFHRVVDSWSVSPPTHEQLDRIREHVAEVLQLVKSEAPTRRLRRSA
jgi:hypothetical protein